MSRLIDADALKANVPNTNVDMFENCRNCTTLCDWEVKELIDKQPTIDAVKVVRCKDCKFYYVFDNVDGVDFGGCARPCSAIRADCWVSENWFCADGEKG